MNAATKLALKERTKEWKAQQKRGFVDAEDMLQKKCSFMEDILTLYSEEIDRLVQPHQRSSVRPNSLGPINNEALQTEFNTAVADAAHYYELYASSQQEVKQLTEEVAFLRMDQAKSTQKSTDDFQRALSRNNERHEQAMRLVAQEGELDRSKLAALEAELQQVRADRDAKAAEDVMTAHNQIESLEHDLAAVRRELAAEHRRVVDLEREVLSSKRRVTQASEFMNQMESLSDRVVSSMTKEAMAHRRLVNSLLMSEEAEKDSTIRRRVGENESEDSEDAHRARIAAKLSGTGLGGQSSATEKLQQLLQHWGAEIEGQQLELAVAARCSSDQHETEQRTLQAKLMESFGHCEVLMQRIQQQEKQQAELKDFLATERDRALDSCDRAVIMVRAMEQANSSRSAVTSVGVQTVRSESVR